MSAERYQTDGAIIESQHIIVTSEWVTGGDTLEFDLNKQFAHRLGIMLDSRLIWYKHYYLWCDKIIEEMNNPPIWIIELSTIKLIAHAAEIVRGYAYSEPFEKFDHEESVNLYISCLYLRYLRREISWATFLLNAGDYSDGYGGKKESELFYELLVQYEDSEFKVQVERTQSAAIGIEYKSEISEIKNFYDIFMSYFRLYVKQHHE